MPLKDFDIFPKMREDFKKQTTASGILTLICILLSSILFIGSCVDYWRSPVLQRLRVDDAPLPMKSGFILDADNLPKVQIHFDITMLALPCAFLHFRVMDRHKEFQADSFTKVKLQRLDKEGKEIPKQKPRYRTWVECGSCYGAANGCCNTCKDVKRAFKAKGQVPPPLSTIAQCKELLNQYERMKDEQCHVYGTLIAPPASGVFELAPGDSYGEKSEHTLDYLALNLTVDDFNMSHHINSLYMGENDPGYRILDGVTKVQDYPGRMKSLYFLRGLKENRKGLETYRISVTHYDRYREGNSGKFPGIFFHYDLAPIIIEYNKEIPPYRFLLNLMAIMGGTFSIGVFIDHLIKTSDEKLS